MKSLRVGDFSIMDSPKNEVLSHTRLSSHKSTAMRRTAANTAMGGMMTTNETIDSAFSLQRKVIEIDTSDLTSRLDVSIVECVGEESRQVIEKVPPKSTHTVGAAARASSALEVP